MDLRPVIKGGALRFLVGIATGLGVWYGVDALGSRMSVGSTDVLGVGNLVLCLTAGYVVTLSLLRPTAHAAEDIESKRSYLAGFMGFGILAALDLLFEIIHPGLGVLYGRHASRIAMEAAAFTTGGFTTFGFFFFQIGQRNRDAAELAEALDSLPSVARADSARVVGRPRISR